ncbi:response regulator transcription factor [Mucilaginibacter agri]|uniref:Response regulator n=1 Tax=Mucilaginibacter agri TaxID=2695265 RepID=A0A965ZM95_9SPHI|nr:response regulator transcription factor [Mucilaginibacter agri]NCD72301.1 response regulator [Mucilaginibacter agri]
MEQIKIAIADDYAIYRDGLKIGLKPDRNLHVVLEAGNGVELLERLDGLDVDVILMDLKMPLMDGIEATREVKKKFPSVKILAITMYDDDKFIIHLMENGANGYLLKNTEPEEIRKAIYAAHESGYYFNDIVNKALLKKLVLRGNFKPSFNQQIDFTEREMEVLKLICNEKTAAEIGHEIFLSPRSVEGIRQRLIDKIGVRNTAGLVMFAVKSGII